ncbi:aminoglycoside phosphotransferase family protein [Salana multivorans]
MGGSSDLPGLGSPGSPGLPEGMPDALEHLTRVADGRAWLARVPELLARARDRWDLELTEPFTSGAAAWTCLARRRGDTRWGLVLKIGFPHDEAEHEADALLHWQGHGAPRLVDHDPEDWALLMHALLPGTPLSASSLTTERALRAGARVIAELHAAPAPGPGEFPRVEDTVAWWGDLVAERAQRHGWAPTDHALVAQWPRVVDELLAAPHRRVLLHGDANPGNLLAGEGDHGLRWYAINPKALVGDPAFDPWPLLEQVDPDPFTASDPVEELLGRASLVASLLLTTPKAVAGWSFVRRLESTLWVTNLVPEHGQGADHPERVDLEREWRETQVWFDAYSRA